MISNYLHNDQKVIYACLIPLIFMLTLPVTNATVSSSRIKKIHDLRVIVDISGSMKKTDPQNLRRPAVRLLAGLIPEGSRSGIWNFGQQVNMSVKIGAVNDAWRALAREQSKKINSVGLYTNIESAMRKASFDWSKPDPRYKRNLIVLTDGHVDISQDDEQDKKSRNRILKEILPALEKAQVRIHTIALSDDVDENLLSTLSAYTDGLYKKVSSANDLQKLFLQMLEQSIKLDTLPLKDNQFNVDSSVNDMTLLVFNKNTAAPTELITPDNKTWNEKLNLKKVKWFKDEGFDLITIKNPRQGQWKIIAPEDKNNRVVVATNLKLDVNDLPSYLMFGDVVKVAAQLQEDGKPLTNKELLSRFDFSIVRNIDKQGEWLYEMSRPEENKNISEYQLPAIYKKGVNELVIKAKSPTVEREVRHQFTVYDTPAEITISENNGQYEVKITPYENLIKPDSVTINIVLKDKSKHELLRKENSWYVNVDHKYKQTNFTVNIKAVRADDKPITMSFEKALSSQGETQGLKLTGDDHGGKINLNLKQKFEEANKIKIKEKNKSVHDEVQEAEDKLPNRIKTRKKETDMSWPVIIGLVAAGNVILIILLGGGYLFLRKRKAKLTKDMTDEIGNLESDVSKKNEETSEGQ